MDWIDQDGFERLIIFFDPLCDLMMNFLCKTLNFNRNDQALVKGRQIDGAKDSFDCLFFGEKKKYLKVHSVEKPKCEHIIRSPKIDFAHCANPVS